MAVAPARGDAGGRRAPDGPPQLGRDIFSRGKPEGVVIVRRAVWDVKLYDLLSAYGHQVRPKDADTYQIEPMQFFSVEEAAERLGRMLASPSTGRRWRPSCRPASLIRPAAARRWRRPSWPACSSPRRAVGAASQAERFAPIYLRKRSEQR